MWVMTTGGFVSAVQETGEPDKVSVRARDRQSLQTLLDTVETVVGEDAPEIRTGEGTDYPYRVTVTKKAFAHYLAFEVIEYLKYDNFKSAATASRGEKWHDALMDTWIAMRKVTDDAGKRHGVYGYLDAAGGSYPRSGRWATGGEWAERYGASEPVPDDATKYGHGSGSEDDDDLGSYTSGRRHYFEDDWYDDDESHEEWLRVNGLRKVSDGE